MGLKNLPTEEPAALASLIDAAPGTVASMALSRLGDACSLTLLAFSAGESVSEEAYEGDTLYYLVEGEADIRLPGRVARLRAGEVLAVGAGTLHAVEPRGAVKLLQLTL